MGCYTNPLWHLFIHKPFLPCAPQTKWLNLIAAREFLNGSHMHLFGVEDINPSGEGSPIHPFGFIGQPKRILKVNYDRAFDSRTRKCGDGFSFHDWKGFPYKWCYVCWGASYVLCFTNGSASQVWETKYRDGLWWTLLEYYFYPKATV